MPLSIERKIHNHVEASHPFFSSSLDSYLKWIPYASVFLLRLIRVKTKSDWKKQTLIVAATETIRFLITDNLKKIVGERRPAPYIGHHSFPSGHTSSSFGGAEFMHKELKDSIPVLSCAGYLGATVTGAIRIYKSKHWLKDVLAGAAIGVISARFAYFLVNRIWKNRKNPPGKTGPTLTEEKMKAQVA